MPTATRAKVPTLTCSGPRGQATHCTRRAMAQASGISLRSGQRIGDAHRLQPHRLRSFKRFNAPACTRKVEDSLGRQIDPPMHTVLLSIDEKCQIQALGRTQPGLPQRHPRWVFQVTPTSASWLHATEDFVSTPTRRRLRRGMLQAAADPEQPIAAASTSTTPPRSIPMDQARRYPPRQARPAACFRMSDKIEPEPLQST